MLAVRDNERAAAAEGVNVMRVKLLAFAIASFLAGLAGALVGYLYGNVSFDAYAPLASVTAPKMSPVVMVWPYATGAAASKRSKIDRPDNASHDCWNDEPLI